MTEKNYALVKDSIVVNVIVFDNPSDELLEIFKNEHNADMIILGNDNAVINSTYDGYKFWLPQPYPSWAKNEETNQWEAPIAKPDDRLYKWNEEDLSWELIMPMQPYPSWTFDENFWSWIPPTPIPNDGKDYNWVEDDLNWQLVEETPAE